MLAIIIKIQQEEDILEDWAKMTIVPIYKIKRDPYDCISLQCIPRKVFTEFIQRRIIIVISKLLRRYSKAKSTRAPAYSRALRRIKEGFPKGESREVQVRFPEYQEGTE